MTDLPIAGAAMMIEELEAHRDWLLEKPRDLEIQNFFKAEVLESDWSALVERAKTLLDGHTGRLGIHGPFWGFTIDSQDPDVRTVRYQAPQSGSGRLRRARRDANGHS